MAALLRMPQYQVSARKRGPRCLLRPGQIEKDDYANIRIRWHDAIRTLAKLHRVNAKNAGLGDFGRPNGFYSRQVRTFGTIMDAQAKVKDIETGKAVGYMPNAEEMLAFFKNPTTQPSDRGTIIHGDYKIDNMVFHKTEPRVIGILEFVAQFERLIRTDVRTSAGRCLPSATHFPTWST